MNSDNDDVALSLDDGGIVETSGVRLYRCPQCFIVMATIDREPPECAMCSYQDVSTDDRIRLKLE